MSDSIIMTMGQFRRLIREASCDAWDNMADDGHHQRAEVAEQLLRDSWSGDINFEYWKDMVRAHLTMATTSLSMDRLDAAIKACAESGGSGVPILQLAVLDVTKKKGTSRDDKSFETTDLDEGQLADAVGKKGQELVAAMGAVKAALKKLSPEDQEKRAAEVNRQQELLLVQLNKLIEDLG